MLFPLHKKLQRLPSIFRTDDFHAPALQKLPRNLNIERMILREKHPLPPERGKRLSGTPASCHFLLWLNIRERKIQMHLHLRALADRARDCNTSAKLLHNILCNCQPQSAAVPPFRLIPSFLRKRLKQQFLKLPAHADSGVRDNIIRRKSTAVNRIIAYPPRDLSPFRSELDRVPQQIKKELLQSDRIHHDIQTVLAAGHVKCDPLFGALRLCHVPDGFHKILERIRLRMQPESSQFNHGNIHEIIQKPHQKPARRINFSKTFHHLLRVIRLFKSDRRHSHDHVHRRLDVIADAGEKIRPCIRDMLQRLIPLTFCLPDQNDADRQYRSEKQQENQQQDSAFPHGLFPPTSIIPTSSTTAVAT